MSPRHLLLTLFIVCLWGVNFTVIKVGLENVSPLAFGVARFVLAAFPWVFFVKPLKSPKWKVAVYSLFMFALQFGLVFVAMKTGVSAGLAALILQLQAFFTIGLAVAFLGQKPRGFQYAGAALAFCGIGVVAAHTGGETPLSGVLMLAGAAAAWAAGNVTSRLLADEYGSENAIGLVCWGSLFAIPPLALVAWFMNPGGFVADFTQFDMTAIGALLFIVYSSTLFAFAAWSWLMARYPVATVAPFALLVPIFAFLSSHIALGEPLEPWKLIAAALVIAGLIVNQFGGRFFGAAGRGK